MSKKKLHQKLFKALYWGLLLLFVWLIYRNVEDYSALVNTFRNADWISLGYAFMIGLGNLFIYALIYESNFRVLSEVKKFPGYFQEVLISFFLSITTPIGTTGGNAYMITYLRGLGFSSLRAAFSITAAMLSSMTIFLALLTVTLRYLNIQHQLNEYQVIGTLSLLAFLSAFVVVLLTVLIFPSFSIKLATLVAKFLNWMPNRFVGRDFIEEKRIQKYTREVMDMSTNFDKSILKFIGTLKFSVAYHLFNIIVLYITFRAYGAQLPISTILIVYSILVLFSTMSPTPQGIGIAEGLAHLAAVSVGVPGSKSLITILTFRVFTIWLPAFLGFLLFRKKLNASNQ